MRFRKADVSEPHAWQPPTVKALQSVVGSARRNVPQPTDPAGAFAIYTRGIARSGGSERFAGNSSSWAELGLNEVETPASCVNDLWRVRCRWGH